jgi:predicted ATP-dependent endonuclease of OLD family
MRINSFRIFNYKSFSDSGQHSLGPNINLVVGQNNVGKTALMQALSLQFMSRPHRDSNMRREDVGSPISQIEFTLLPALGLRGSQTLTICKVVTPK